MKKRIATATAVLMAMGVAFTAQAQEIEGKADVGGVKGKAEVNLPEDKDSSLTKDSDADARITYRSEREGHSKVTKVNKASGIIGMEVKNHQGETLGEIQDLVINWSDASISYAVLSVGGFLGLGEKYIAVPPSAFKMDGTEDRLVLNVDKAKVEQAPGFAKTNWPEVDNPAWGAAADWGKDTDRDLNLRGEVGRDRDINIRGEIDRDRDADVRGRLDTDRDRDLNKDAEIRARGQLGDRDADLRIRADEPSEHMKTFKGRVTAVDVEDRTITVSGASGTETFKMAERPTLTLQGNRNAKIVDFKVGYNVVVEYDHHDGEMVARKIMQTSPTELK